MVKIVSSFIQFRLRDKIMNEIKRKKYRIYVNVYHLLEMGVL